jgi:hypothetical protein
MHCPGKKGPIIVLQCQAKVLKNSKAQERFQDILPKFEWRVLLLIHHLSRGAGRSPIASGRQA